METHEEKQKALHTAYRRTFFDNPYGLVVFEDLMDRTCIFEDRFWDSIGRGDAKNDNAYEKGRRSIMTEILGVMGITGGVGQLKKVAEALSGVLPSGIDKQKDAES